MLRRPVAAALVAAALLTSTVGAQEAQPGDGPRLHVEAGEVEATAVIERWAALTGKVVTIDPQVQPIRLEFTAPAAIDASTLRHVLDAHDVVLVERDGMLQAHHRRNLNQKVGPPWDLVEGLAPDDLRLVTCVVQVRHGAGNSIFATIRGMLTRDTNRIGNILYVQGPEVIIIVDLAPSVRYYQEIISKLDQPPPVREQRAQLTVYEVQRAAWTRLQAGAPSAAARAEALRAASGDQATGVVQLAEGQFLGSEPVSIQRVVSEGRGQTALKLELGRPARVEGAPEDGLAPVSADGLHLRLALTVVSEGGGTLTLSTHTRFAAAGGPVVQSFSGRGGAQPTDVIVVLE